MGCCRNRLGSDNNRIQSPLHHRAGIHQNSQSQSEDNRNCKSDGRDLHRCRQVYHKKRFSEFPQFSHNSCRCRQNIGRIHMSGPHLPQQGAQPPEKLPKVNTVSSHTTCFRSCIVSLAFKASISGCRRKSRFLG